MMAVTTNNDNYNDNDNVQFEFANYVSDMHGKETGLVYTGTREEIWSYIRSHINIPWNWYDLSIHQLITWDHVTDAPFLRWDHSQLTLNPNITFDIIMNNISFNWDLNALAIKENITDNEYAQIMTAYDNWMNEPDSD